MTFTTVSFAFITLQLFLCGTSVAQSGCESDVLFLLDATGSVRDEYPKQLDYIVRVIEGLNIGPATHQVSLVLYSSGVRQRIAIKFGEYEQKDKLIEAVKGQPFLSGITNTGAAIRLAGTALESRRPTATTNVIVVTDGFSWDEVEAPAAELRNGKGARLFAVAVVDPYNIDDLQLIGDTPSNVFIGMESVSELLNALGTCVPEPTLPPTTRPPATQPPPVTEPPPLVTEPPPIKTQAPPVVTEAPPPVVTEAPPVVTGAPPVATEAPPVTDAPTPKPTIKPPTPQKCFIDLMFIIDSSSSVVKTFKRELDFASDLVDTLTLGEKQARVALIRFYGRAFTDVKFDDYVEKEPLKAAIQKVKHNGGLTRIATALELANEEFSEGRGSRPGATPIVIIFTDGFTRIDTRPAAEKLHNRGAIVYAVGIGETKINRIELEIIAGDPARVYTEENFADFTTELQLLTADC